MNFTPSSFYLNKYFLLFTCLACSHCLFSQDFIINNYDVEIKISQEGHFNVQEKIDVLFLEKARGIKRYIPKKIKHNNKTQQILLKEVDASKDEVALIQEGGNYVIRLGNKNKFITGRKSYDISYRVYNAFLFEENHSEFLYNIIGDWDVPIKKVSYRILLPTELEMPFNDYKVITGSLADDKRDASIKKEGSIIGGESFKALNPHQFITVALKLPEGYISQSVVQPMSPQKSFSLKSDKFWIIPLAFIAWFLNFFIQRKKVEVNQNPEVQYFPPADFSPAEVGAYYDNRYDTIDIISLLPYWAEKGIISISSHEFESSDGDLFFRKNHELDSFAPEYQKIIFNGLFEHGNVVMLSELKNDIYKSHHKSSNAIKKKLIQRELYDVDHTNLFHSGKLLILALGLVITGVLLIIFKSLLITALITFVAAIMLLVIHFLEPKRSQKGIAIQNHLLGFKNFIENGDGQKTQELLKKDSRYFEKIFPYAIAFGIDQEWLEKLSDYDLNAPTWYGYEGHGNSGRPSYGHFSKSFSVPEIKSVFTSMPSHSGSSGGGSFSGGSAGGGFGGGGSSW